MPCFYRKPLVDLATAVKSLSIRVKRGDFDLLKVKTDFSYFGKQMKKYIVLGLLALITMTGAVLEGLVDGLPQQVVQANGVLTIVSAMILVVWALKVQASDL